MSNKLGLLIVDDDKNSVGLLYDYFMERDYRVFKASNGTEALKIIEQDEVNVVVTDQRMPKMLGTELLTRLKKEVPEVTRVLLTAYIDLEMAIEAINKGIIHRYLSKPLDLEVLDGIVAEQKRIKERLESQQQQLAQIDKMASLGIMAAGVAHEINNPLNVAIGDVHLFGRDFRDLLQLVDQFSKISLPPDMLKEIEKFKKDMDLPYLREGIDSKLSRCTDAMNRVKDIVRSLKSFSHLDEEEMAETDVNKTIETALKMIPKKNKQNILIKTEYALLPKIFCHARQITQIFTNIIINALQAMKEEGALNISSSSDNTSIYIKLCDTGPGISEDKIKKIFDPFFTTKPVGEGTGLGLSISYSIIKKHGGDITVANNADKGTTFTVKLLK